MFVRCNAHNMNLVVQDSLENVPEARNFIGLVKDIVTFVRDSPKRLAMFRELDPDADEGMENSIDSEPKNKSINKKLSLTAYCPTRYLYY